MNKFTPPIYPVTELAIGHPFTPILRHPFIASIYSLIQHPQGEWQHLFIACPFFPISLGEWQHLFIAHPFSHSSSSHKGEWQHLFIANVPFLPFLYPCTRGVAASIYSTPFYPAPTKGVAASIYIFPQGEWQHFIAHPFSHFSSTQKGSG